MKDNASPVLGLYIHWPFCLSKCPYCDFNSHVRAAIDEDYFHTALLKELDWAYRKTPDHTLVSIFFGGGTPSLMPAKTVEALIAKAKMLWSHDPDLEITLEANPTSFEAGKFQDFRDAGVNRISIGVQSLRDDGLKALGRQHDVAQAKRTIESALNLFPRCSFDLIYAREHQTTKAWEAELQEALSLGTQHLSLYQLTIEKGTAFYTLHQRGDLIIPGEEKAEEMYRLTEDITYAHNMPAYEVSNYARADQECRHNLVYWQYRDYIGIGPGAHSRVYAGTTKMASHMIKSPELWATSVHTQGHGIKEETPLTTPEQLDEFFLMGMRLSQGITHRRFQEETGMTMDAYFNAPRLAALIESKDLILDAQGLRPTLLGRLRLNAIVDYLRPV